jgi:hypothetical protein
VLGLAAQSKATGPHDAAAALNWRCELDERLAGLDVRAFRSAIVVVVSKMLGQRGGAYRSCSHGHKSWSNRR